MICLESEHPCRRRSAPCLASQPATTRPDGTIFPRNTVVLPNTNLLHPIKHSLLSGCTTIPLLLNPLFPSSARNPLLEMEEITGRVRTKVSLLLFARLSAMVDDARMMRKGL